MPEKFENLQGDVMNEAQTREDLINPAIRASVSEAPSAKVCG